MKIIKLNNSKPYRIFEIFLKKALKNKQKNFDAISISSFNPKLNQVDSRFVNLKYIDEEEWIFFSNYNSSKAKDFKEHNQISALIFWSSINVQIRLKAKIKKTSSSFNKNYFSKRDKNKNALAISSNQSRVIDSHDGVIKDYYESLELHNLKECPDYWGGYSFTPYYFEFWEGHEYRLNKRNIYEKNGDNWNHFILQP